MAVLLSTFSWLPIFSHSRSLTTFPSTLTPLRRNRNVLAMAASNEEANYNLATNTKNSNIVRPVIANFPPSLWGDRFTSFNMDVQLSNMYAEEIKVLKEEARNMLISCDNKLSERLVLIDTIERLGLSYHFENEIQEQLTLAFNGHLKLELEENNDLFINSLQFRLLRQHALDAPSSIFKNFTENNGEFKKALSTDIEGLLALYEASYLRRNDEEILDEAFSFSKANLESVAPNLRESPLKKQVLHALDQSLLRGTSRVEARRFISLYEELESKNESLLRLAKLDFNLLQMQHKTELSELTMWWKEIDLASKLPYVRDRVVEAYFWAMGIYHEPQYSDARIMQTVQIEELTTFGVKTAISEKEWAKSKKGKILENQGPRGRADFRHKSHTAVRMGVGAQ
ncbi:hypothetical protein ABFX02_01G033700 [Erythranthe guttata]